MNYIYIALFLLIIVLVTDLTLSLFRLRMSGIAKGYKLVFKGIGYVNKKGCSFRNNSLKKVLIVGDSTAVGACIDPEETIGGRLSKKFNIDVINLGLNGVLTKDVATQIKSVSDKKFYLTIIHIGNNDIWRFTDLNKLKKDFTQLINETKLISKKIIVIKGGNFALIPGFPFLFRWIWCRRSRMVKNLFKNISEEKNIYYVERFIETNEDAADLFLKKPYPYHSWDLIHLNGEGYRVWFDYLLEEMQKMDIDLGPQFN